MDALTLTPKCKVLFVRVALQFFTYFSPQNTDRGINHSIHAVHVASIAIIIFSLLIGIEYGIMYTR